ncbi:MAG: nucleotidyltransferase substrate binding protein [Ignavibacteria bacterium]
MKDDLKVALHSFNNALTSLEQGLKEAKRELEKDGVIQRFEFTFELMWKSLKIFLYDEGIECKSPRDCLRKAFKYGIIKNEEIVLDMLIDRNNSTHIYNKDESEEIFQRIKSDYITELKKIYKKIK